MIQSLPEEVLTKALDFLDGRNLTMMVPLSRDLQTVLGAYPGWSRIPYDLSGFRKTLPLWKAAWEHLRKSIHIRRATILKVPKHRSPRLYEDVTEATGPRLQVLDLTEYTGSMQVLFYALERAGATPRLTTLIPPRNPRDEVLFCGLEISHWCKPGLAGQVTAAWPVRHKAPNCSCRHAISIRLTGNSIGLRTKIGV